MKRPKPSKSATQAGYETRDVTPRKVIYAGIGLFLGTAISIALVMGILALLPASERPVKLAIETGSQQAPTPRLEINGRADRALIEDAAAAKLTGYAWADRSAGTVRIPIARAMELLAARGWSDAAEAPAP
jgi:hypothetical protein